MRRFFVVSCLLLTGVTVSSAASAASVPRGSVVLKSSSLKKIGTTQCGKVKGSWVAGKVTKVKTKNYFLSHSTASKLFSADAKKSRGAQRLKFLRLAKKYKTKASVANKNCSRLNNSAPVVTTVPSPAQSPKESTEQVATTVPASAQQLKFDFGNAVALALTETSVKTASVRKKSTGSNLQAVDVAGNMRDAVVSGKARIKKYLIAPNDKLYVEFEDAPEVGGSPCLLAEISKADGLPICIERDLEFKFVAPGQNSDQWGLNFRPLRNDIQFDAEGNVYYLGTPSTWKKQFPGLTCLDTGLGGSAGQVVRRYSNGRSSDFGVAKFVRGLTSRPGFSGDYSNCVIIENEINNFLVLKDGGLLIDQALIIIPKGQLPDGSQGWGETRRLDYWSKDGDRTEIEGFAQSPTGGTERTALGFLRIMEQRAVLIGWQNSVHQVDLEAKKLIPPTNLGNYSTYAAFQGAQCVNSQSRMTDFDTYFCEVGGTTWRSTWKTPDGKVFAVSGQDPYPYVAKSDSFYDEFVSLGGFTGAGFLFQVWPTIDLGFVGGNTQDKILNRVETFLPVLDSLAVCGLGTDGIRRSILYNTTSRTSVEIIPGNLKVSVKKFAFSATSNSILFLGIQGPEQQAVFGKVDLVTKDLAMSNISSSVSDLQAFSS